jgi:hypothetical protein
MPFTNKKIPAKHAKRLMKNYKTHKNKYLKNSKDSRGIWFSREVLLEALGITTDPGPKETTGLRFYFAGYESKASTGYPGHEIDEWKATLVFVATSEEWLEVPERENERMYKDKITDEERDAEPEYETSLHPYNDGQLCPPPPVSDLGLYNKV